MPVCGVFKQVTCDHNCSETSLIGLQMGPKVNCAYTHDDLSYRQIVS